MKPNKKLTIPKGYEAGSPSYKVTQEQNFYPKLTVGEAPLRGKKGKKGKLTKFKPYVQDVRVVNVKQLKSPKKGR